MLITMKSTPLRPERRQKCCLGCPTLDGLLHGGIPCGSLTELVGESASCKTQISLQLSLRVQLPLAEGGLHGSALYIFTESYFPWKRLRQLAQSSVAGAKRCDSLARGLTVDSLGAEKVSRTNQCEGTGLNGELGFPTKGKQDAEVEFNVELMRSSRGRADGPQGGVMGDSSEPVFGVANSCNNIFVRGIQKADELLEYLDHASALLAHPFRRRVRLLVIDSIAALFRSDFDHTADQMIKRTSLVFKIASKLKRLAEVYDLALVVTNQVSDYFEPVSGSRSDDVGLSWRGPESEVLVTSGRRIVPALGLSWAHCVNTRLFLSRADNEEHSLRRSLQVVFSPYLPCVSQEFLVDIHGVRGRTHTDRKLSDACSMECCNVSSTDNGKRPKISPNLHSGSSGEYRYECKKI